jgi:hypothetical protein
MTIRFCDDRGPQGFSWIVDEPMTRTSHALVSGDMVWLVDPVDWPQAIERASALVARQCSSCSDVTTATALPWPSASASRTSPSQAVLGSP